VTRDFISAILRFRSSVAVFTRCDKTIPQSGKHREINSCIPSGAAELECMSFYPRFSFTAPLATPYATIPSSVWQLTCVGERI
jgi:hypothetical protein